jgi:hypothetical protein
MVTGKPTRSSCNLGRQEYDGARYCFEHGGFLEYGDALNGKSRCHRAPAPEFLTTPGRLAAKQGTPAGRRPCLCLSHPHAASCPAAPPLRCDCEDCEEKKSATKKNSESS